MNRSDRNATNINAKANWLRMRFALLADRPKDAGGETYAKWFRDVWLPTDKSDPAPLLRLTADEVRNSHRN